MRGSIEIESVVGADKKMDLATEVGLKSVASVDVMASTAAAVLGMLWRLISARTPLRQCVNPGVRKLHRLQDGHR